MFSIIKIWKNSPSITTINLVLEFKRRRHTSANHYEGLDRKTKAADVNSERSPRGKQPAAKMMRADSSLQPGQANSSST
ncbi:hypothetical protein DPMN_001896 [Dreissena polymorpha]|uniref:Uncharacterized protein n=1 Tax=Dreissena polymorpha TaxID=45954 RepID=A0A9D4MKM3_DREPO|nr:hypothetical protein DPMN_001896 [Dreissena polymorpha]